MDFQGNKTRQHIGIDGLIVNIIYSVKKNSIKKCRSLHAE